MASWHRRAQLTELAERTLGHPEGAHAEYGRLEEVVDALWQRGVHDYRYYDDPLYVYNCVNCFCDFTKGCARYFARWYNEVRLFTPRLNEVLDYGCGVAASSRLWREETDVGVIAHYYADWDEVPLQRVLGEAVCEGVDRIVHVSARNPTDLRWYGGPAYDGVMAFELFEHELEPLALFDSLVGPQFDGSRPWVVCEASSFGTDFKYGHHPSYIVDGHEVPRERMTRVWKKGLAARGWRSAASGWNGRPRVWVREDAM